MAANLRGVSTWLLTPSVEEGPRSHAFAAVALRLLAGLLWLYNVSWKHAPDFGQGQGAGLYRYTKDAVDHPVFAPYSWLVGHLVLPHFLPFAWGVLAVETILGVLLLSGAFVRLAAALGVAQSLAIGLSVALAPGEWPWSYAMMVAIHAVLLFSASGRFLSVDAVRAKQQEGRVLAWMWGALGVVAGLVEVVRSAGHPLAASGPALVAQRFQIGIGNYNLLGGVVLLVLGGLLVAWAGGRSSRLAFAAATVAALAGLSLHAQLGFSDPVLGGSSSSAALFFTFAVVAGCLGFASRDQQQTESVLRAEAFRS